MPNADCVGVEKVPVARLDSAAPGVLGETARRAYLKLDVQGAELQVIDGACATLPSVEIIEAELSLIRLYDGAPLYRDVVESLAANGYRLATIDPGFEDARTGEMLQFDGIFVKDERCAAAAAT